MLKVIMNWHMEIEIVKNGTDQKASYERKRILRFHGRSNRFRASITKIKITNHDNLKTNSTRNVLIFLLAFLGLGAILGGAVLIISPSGRLLGMPLSMLKNSPFNSFLLPGLIVFTVLGIVPIALSVVLVKKPVNKLAELFNFYKDIYWGWTFTIYTAFALIIWIQVEMTFLGSVHWLHSFYMLLAIAILFVALLPKVRNHYKI